MILIADSGSTKCDWKLVGNNVSQDKFSTKGFNPFFWTSEEIFSELIPVFDSVLTDQVNKVIFYGSGCSDELRCNTVKNGLSKLFTTNEIHIHHDLLAAARATCGTESGIACIIGTGSNSCLYDGDKIIDNVSNLGYLLGDEGSGSHIGKALIRAYAYREMPVELKDAFEKKYEVTDPKTLVHHIYTHESPNVYLAGFSHFCSHHSDHPFIQHLVKKSFAAFIRRHLVKYEGHQAVPAHFVGSIAYYFRDILEVALNEKGIELGQIVKQPIHNLVSYHKKVDQIFMT